MNHLRMEIVGIGEDRPVETTRNEAGTVVDLVPGRVEHWLVVATHPNGETIQARVSDADWKRVVEPLLDVERAGHSIEDIIRFE